MFVLETGWYRGSAVNPQGESVVLPDSKERVTNSKELFHLTLPSLLLPCLTDVKEFGSSQFCQNKPRSDPDVTPVVHLHAKSSIRLCYWSTLLVPGWLDQSGCFQGDKLDEMFSVLFYIYR